MAIVFLVSISFGSIHIELHDFLRIRVIFFVHFLHSHGV